jgi:hypothetical protein
VHCCLRVAPWWPSFRSQVRVRRLSKEPPHEGGWSAAVSASGNSCFKKLAEHQRSTRRFVSDRYATFPKPPDRLGAFGNHPCGRHGSKPRRAYRSASQVSDRLYRLAERRSRSPQIRCHGFSASFTERDENVPSSRVETSQGQKENSCDFFLQLLARAGGSFMLCWLAASTTSW